MNRGFKGVWIPKEIWLDADLNALEKVILVEIDSLDNGDSHCFANNKHIAEFCQCSEWKVSNAISKLADKGYIDIGLFDGRTRIIKSNISNLSVPPGKKGKNSHVKNPKQPCENHKEPLGNSQGALGKNPRQPLENPNKVILISNIKRKPVSKSGGGGGSTLLNKVENPFGDSAAAAPVPDQLVIYASNNLLPMTGDSMAELVSFRDALPDELIRHAINEACDSGSRNYKYVKAILNRYVEMDFKTVTDVENYERKRRRGRQKSGPTEYHDPDYENDW